MDQIQLIVEFLRALWRRAFPLALVMVLGIGGTLYYAMTRPSEYEASATIQIESQQIPDDLARSTVNLTTAQRLQLIEQRLMSRENLTAVITKLGLFADMPGLALEDRLNILRGAITFNSIAAPGGANGAAAQVFSFSITARMGDAGQVAAIVNEFIDDAVAQNLEVRANRVRETLAYFDGEEQRVGVALAEQEARIAAFKRDNAEALPESLEFRRDEQRRLQQRDMEIDAKLLELQNSRGTLELSLVGQGPAAAAAIPPSPAEVQLNQLQLDLAQKLTVLGPGHPEIRRLRAEIAAVGAVVDSAAPSAVVGRAAPSAVVGPAAPGAVVGSAAPGADTAPEAGVSAAQRSATTHQIEETDKQIALLRSQKVEIAARNKALDASIARTPEVEIALNALTRRFADIQEQYAAIARGKAEASTGEQLEASKQSERFDVIERALVPRYPVGPNRKKLVILGSGASIGFAFGLVFLLELLHPVLRTSAQMERRLGIRPVVSIPYVTTPQARSRRRFAFGLGLATLCAGVIALGMLYQKEQSTVAQFAARYGLEKYLGPSDSP